jgi:glutathione synthase/RimK-type ligase-like ATP-grasp enzyme
VPTRRIALVTCDAVPGLFEEEAQLLPLLAAEGFEARAVSWSDPHAQWNSFDLVVLRSTWDYFERFAEFERWLSRLERGGVALQNPLSLVRWNTDKRYLQQLAARGVRIIPTRFVQQGDRAALVQLLEEERWGQAILKPAVSGNAYRTVRIAAGDGARHQEALDTILQSGAALVQPFVDEVLTDGEHSLFFFDGRFSHAVQKVPRAGDFRVQVAYGSTVRRVDPDPQLIGTALQIIAALPAAPLYVRIDGVRREAGFALMEVEAIEPYLFLAWAPEAIPRYVAAVARAARG